VAVVLVLYNCKKVVFAFEVVFLDFLAWLGFSSGLSSQAHKQAWRR